MSATATAAVLAMAMSSQAVAADAASAAIVIDGKVVIVQPTKRKAVPLVLPVFRAEEADLSPDRKLLAVNAQISRDSPMRLYLVDLLRDKAEEIKTSIDGDHRFPRFTNDGRAVLFSASKVRAQGGPANPLRLFQMNVASRVVQEVPTREATCSFSPVSLAGGRIAFLWTSCFIGFELAVLDARSGEEKVLASVSGPTAELAAPPDGKSFVYTTAGQTGLQFWLRGLTAAAPKLIATVVPTERRLQPRFVSGHTLVFFNKGRFFELDVNGGGPTALFAYENPDTPRPMK